MKKTTFLTTLFFLLVLFTSAVHSQTASPSASPEPTPKPLYTTYEQLENDYRYQYELYRQALEKYHFEKAEYNKLKTLASQEDAVAATKEVLIARAKVLISHLNLLERVLLDQNHVTPADRNAALDRVKQARLFLQTHVEEVPKLFDKENVVYASQDFEDDVVIVHEAQYRAMALIAINRIQQAFDQLALAASDFNQNIISTIADTSQRSATERGFKEVARLISSADSSLNQAKTKFLEFETDNPSKAKSKYNQIVSYLKPAQADMVQAVDFLIELEKNSRP